ncbi:MAG TPA: GNAT family N-acetyltransferase [Xanthobacteraceae bacterium]|nr:GNAT family N-acetyltransferase [Xanthobacteraceae bacterium]
MPRPLLDCGIHRLELFSDFAAAEPHWRALEKKSACTPYQHFDWMEAWQRHLGAAENIVPLLLTGFDRAGDPIFLLPFGYRAGERCKIVHFLGGKHANYNFGPWRQGFSCGTDAVYALLDWLHHVRPELDGVELLNQPESWDGMQNPLFSLPRQQSPSDGFWLSLNGEAKDVTARVFTSSRRKRLRYRERKLQDFCGYRHVRATTQGQAEKYLEAFFAQKDARLTRQGIENAFAAAGAAEFVRELCTKGLAEGRPIVELHALDCDDDVMAIFACVNDRKRYASMFNSFTLGPASRYSPGVVLISYIVRDCIERGIQSFDLGVGEAEYKTYYCDQREMLFDSYLGFSARGQAYVATLSAKATLKRWIKRSPAMMKLVAAARRLRAGAPSGGEAA